jgi:sulfonate transport system substrate-binding protein
LCIIGRSILNLSESHIHECLLMALLKHLWNPIIVSRRFLYIANRDFARNHGPVLQQIVDVTASTAKWAEAHRDEVAKSLSAITGIPLDIQTVAANRASFAVGPITEDIIATQQGVADRFFKLGLIPKPIAIRDIVWRNTQT